MKVLVACEFSGIVREAFKSKGHDAWSCDLLPTEIPGQHIQGDVLGILDDGWDLMIAHPPCTYLTVAANKWMLPEFKERFPNREVQRKEAIEFVKALGMAPIERICIENPVGILSTVWRPPNQYIQPWQFGENAVKKTGLWLKNLPCLKPTQIVEPEYIIYNSSTKKSGKPRYPVAWGSLKAIYANQTPSGQNNVTPSPDRWKIRSKTYQGIAEAMAEQWGGTVND